MYIDRCGSLRKERVKNYSEVSGQGPSDTGDMTNRS